MKQLMKVALFYDEYPWPDANLLFVYSVDVLCFEFPTYFWGLYNYFTLILYKHEINTSFSSMSIRLCGSEIAINFLLQYFNILL